MNQGKYIRNMKIKMVIVLIREQFDSKLNIQIGFSADFGGSESDSDSHSIHTKLNLNGMANLSLPSFYLLI